MTETVPAIPKKPHLKYSFKPGNTISKLGGRPTKYRNTDTTAFTSQPLDKQDSSLAQASRSNAMVLSQTIAELLRVRQKIDHSAIRNLAIAFGICKQRGEQTAPAKFNMVINLFGSLPSREMQQSVSEAPLDLVAVDKVVDNVTPALPTPQDVAYPQEQSLSVQVDSQSYQQDSDDGLHKRSYPTLQYSDANATPTGTLGSGAAGAGAAAGKHADVVEATEILGQE